MVSDIKNRKKQLNNDEGKNNKEINSKEPIAPKYGPMPKHTSVRVFSRGIVIVGVLVYVWYFSKGGRESILAKHDVQYQGRGQNVECNKDYLREIQRFTNCVPKKCGRFVNDRIITDYEADVLQWFAKRGMAKTEVSGGVTIIDLHSGTMSYKDGFINFHTSKKNNFITPIDLKTYKSVRQKIQAAVAQSFGIDPDHLYLTHPTFFSKLTYKDAVTLHDEYWHVHVDKYAYKSFHYTTLLYLNNYNINFKGGRFMFVNDFNEPTKNITIEPRKGRVSMFTSGAENPHFVERVTEGERFAITISFTCDPSKSINDPTFKDDN
ncbi:hypothetical protein GWI33_008376 [Rhynchophorus ferrugineus]|uniref:Prolyl 4-hydroxylase alpha subunit domain-containing protein n=1 Tax=Rhynchophorus ferrugineus TaxID=354439 RepID=A0A834IR67_RHYFE|nr:hypothetical protein GWI33_008376 [Rhynchophorus ferrugineus]